MPIVIMSSLENYPVIPISPREVPLCSIPLCIAYQRIGARHYDATIDNLQQPQESAESTCSSCTSYLTPPSSSSSHQNKQMSCQFDKVPTATQVGCRCGRGSAKNKEARLFCCEYKDGCKCFQSITGCTDGCSCYNYGNPHGKKDVATPGTLELVPRKRRRHVAGQVFSMQGDIFVETRGTDAKPSPWTPFEELVIKESVFYLNAANKLYELSLHEMYNNAVIMPQEFSIHAEPTGDRMPIREVWEISNV